MNTPAMVELHDGHVLDWLQQLPASDPRFSEQREAAAWFEYWVERDNREAQESATARLSQHLVQLQQQLIEQQAKPTFASRKEEAEERHAQRYQMCIDAGLTMPKTDYERMPDGVGKIAIAAGVARQTFTADVKKPIRRLMTNR